MKVDSTKGAEEVKIGKNVKLSTSINFHINKESVTNEHPSLPGQHLAKKNKQIEITFNLSIYLVKEPW